jgi:Predicted exonuclease
MITISDTFSTKTKSYPLETIGNPEEILFFDIETTGFLGDRCSIYIIGCVYIKNNQWHYIQWFADSLEAEKDVLHSFFKLMINYKYIIHFNGDGFDIPFVNKRLKHYSLSYNFNNIKSIDIYKQVRPLKKLLGLLNLKQKSIETFLNINRQDTMSGGDLINVYYDYLETKDDRAKYFLLLHNSDDLKGMPEILSILSYHDLFNADYIYEHHELSNKQYLIITGASSVYIPSQIDNIFSFGSLSFYEYNFKLTLSLYEGECKYFYNNYKDYYYLPNEDRAIHKSVAEFLDKSHRKKATAKTCYMKYNGLFFPEKTLIYAPALKRDYTEKFFYVPFKEDIFKDKEMFSLFIRDMVRLI